MESNVNQITQAFEGDFEEATELAALINHAIQHLPDSQRSAARQRVIELIHQKPSAQDIAEIMAILEPGFQAIRGRA